MSDIVDSMNRLREDPEISSALKRAKTGESGGDDANYYHSAPSLKATNQSQGSDAKEFLESRDRERDQMGVGNWVFKHRDEIAAGDADRLAKRLDAESQFAQAQNAIEGFRRDSSQAQPCPGTAILSAGDPGGIRIQPDPVDSSFLPSATKFELPNSSVYASPLPHNSLSSGSTLSAKKNHYNDNNNNRYSGKQQSPSHAAAFGAGNILNQQNSHPNAAAASSSYSSVAPSASAAGGGGSAHILPSGEVALDTHGKFGDIDEMSNYDAKRKMMTRSNIADRVRQSLEPQHFGSVDNSSGLNAALTAAVRTGGNAPKEDSNSLSALMDTIGIRDATIARLEAQIREERRFHDVALTEVKEENETLKDTLRRYDSESAKNIEEIRNSSASEVRAIKEQHSRELDVARVRFDQRVRAVEEDMNRALQSARHNFENALARVDDLQDTSASQFREMLRSERSEALNREKSSLIELLAREQEVLLREGEAKIIAELSRQLQERARTELQRLVHQQTTEVLLPSLKELVTRDVVRAISDRATAAAETHVEDRSRAMRSELERILEEGEKRLEDQASRLAASSVVRWSGVVPIADETQHPDGVAAFKHHAELMRRLQDDSDKLLREQRENDQDHAKKMAALKAQLAQVESDLASEKGVSAALAERLLHVSQ